ncbi:C-C motif chemokine 6-like [Dipodomys merriami]|uniref:C-C motif chemokine 6-like n=1 Tax=Dipodomys spectabilis TaxID=105255 RepID=UPI001C537CF4|nr:C-C motif chemokine 6-like [Dipodomys spectabilis]
MHVPMAAFSFLLLVVTLGSQALVIHESKIGELLKAKRQHGPTIIQQGISRPSDCCFSYTSRRIRCSVIRDYFLTSNGCPLPGLIVLTRRGQRVCANPSDSRIQSCIGILNVTSRAQDLGIYKGEDI